ncbi:MAG: fumarate hydratase, partial [Thermodesulfobacteriota bacterium]
MKDIKASEITSKVKELCLAANFSLGQDVQEAIARAREKEESPLGKEILSQILDNANIAEREQIPMCQDTGFAVFFLELGQEVRVVGGSLYEAINEGVRQGYKDGYLRASILVDPIKRVNTGDNTPAVIHTEIVPGDKLSITFEAKGGGSENMSRLAMLTPAQGLEGVKNFVVDCVRKAGGNPCPPIVVGVGLGGTMEVAALLAKKAVVRELGKVNPDPDLARLEEELLERVNDLGIGPQGLGGRITA